MSTKQEPDYMSQDANFLDHQFEVNPPLFAGLSSERDNSWKRYMTTHPSWTIRQKYQAGKIDREEFEEALDHGDADTRYWSVPCE